MNIWIIVTIYSIVYVLGLFLDKSDLLPAYYENIKDLISFVTTIGITTAVSYVSKNKVDVSDTVKSSKSLFKI